MEKEREPGSARFGNFINYYSFNPPSERLKLIEKDFLKDFIFNEGKTIYILDIGCNTGDLTREFYKNYCQEYQCKILGIDLDETLIERAKSSAENGENMDFQTINIISEYDRLLSYMKEKNINKFDLINCFSVLMWIHLNHGDEILQIFLRNISLLSDNILIEIQPWKCYRNARRRMKKLDCNNFSQFDKLQLKNPDKNISDILLVVINGDSTSSDTVVATKSGLLRGSVKLTSKNEKYSEFVGIPYGKSPTGKLRFAKSEPPERWNGIRNATEFGPHCPQLIAMLYPLIGYSDEVSEDCLSMNIWIPGEVDSTKNLPVMMYLYGGAFLLGMGQMYPGQDLAINGNVIVLNINYRVSSLGFLSTMDSAAKGNWALWDMKLALEWIKDNIKGFGGNPDQVTVFGESAGGSATSLLSLSQQTNSLFKSAIAHSGSASVERDMTELTRRLAESFGCDDDDNVQMIDCLREEDAEDLDLWSLITMGGSGSWRPVVDGEFLTKHPSELWSEGAAKSVRFMTGNLHHDMAGLIILNPVGLPYGDALSITSTKNGTIAFVNGLCSSAKNSSDVCKEVWKRYPGMDDDDMAKRTLATIYLATDWVFGSGSNFEARAHSMHSDVGSYMFNLQHDMSFLEYPNYINGSHLDDCYPLFGEPFLLDMRHSFLEQQEWSEGDKQYTKNLRSYWLNFVKTGNPNEGPHSVPANWPTYNKSENLILRITQHMSQSSVEQLDDKKLDNYNFFNNIQRNIKSENENQSKFDLMEAISQFLEKMEPLFQQFPSFEKRVLNKINKTISRVIKNRMRKHLKRPKKQ
ncbi:DgyrCDS12535 [Dimorphilus gyrociliatus]|uniref:DgyrCDS12535 n=1 Tax=Dimorphilus gyrociliatus TaxID=2664684 RepID=A0A7I8W7K7_9ANNE|nr:DgyrCDS12535 [Dimorphilus gyrociliatus]